MAQKGARSAYQPKQEAVAAPSGEVSIPMHQVQAEFVACHKPYKAYVGGIGSGKSHIGAYDLLISAEPGSLNSVVAPTYRMLSDSTKRSFIELATKLGLWNESQHRVTDNQAMLNNGVEILFRSGDNPNSLRGPSLRRVWMDEAGLMDESVFNVMIGRLRFGRQMGSLTATFTPQGKEHWTYRLFADETNPNVALFRSSTKDNPFLAREFYDNLLLQYGKGQGGLLRARQELEGDFVVVEGAEWGAEFFTKEFWFNQWPEDREAIRVVHLDSSKGVGGKSGDYSCFCKLMYSKGLLYVEFDMDNQRNASGMAARAVEIQQEFRPQVFGVEAEFGGDVLVDDLQNRAEAAGILMPLALVPTGGHNKEVRIRRLTPFVTRGMLRFMNNEQTRIGVCQMEAFPHGEHDDAPDALEGATRIINEGIAQPTE